MNISNIRSLGAVLALFVATQVCLAGSATAMVAPAQAAGAVTGGLPGVDLGRGCAGPSVLPYQDADKLLVLAHYRLRTAPDDAEALLARGLAYEAMGRQGRASADFLRATAIDPGLTRAHLALGRAYSSHGLLARAIRSYTAAIRLNPASAEAYRERAILYDTLDSFGRALADHKQAIALDPTDACTYNDQGITQEAAGLQPEALASYSKAIELSPTLLPALTNRAFLLSDMGRLGESLTSLRAAEALAPNDPHIRAGIARVRSELEARTT